MSGCRKTALWGLALLVAAFGFVWWKWFPSYTYHQKMTLTVEANGREYSASSVTAVTWSYNYPLPGEFKTATATLEGEAAHLELPGGRHLFALLKTVPDGPVKPNGWPYNAEGLATYVFPEAYTQFYWPADMRRLRATREIPADLRPLLVAFDDLSKPESVRKVNPDFLAGTFGAGVRLKSITLAITDEPVGPGTILGVLPWLPEIWPNHLDGQRWESAKAPHRFANSLSSNSFSTEIRK